MGLEFQNEMKVIGHTVVTGQRFVVVNIDDKLSGVDDSDEPLELDSKAVVYVSKNQKHKVFYDNIKSVVINKIRDNLPDITKESINVAKG